VCFLIVKACHPPDHSYGPDPFLGSLPSFLIFARPPYLLLLGPPVFPIFSPFNFLPLENNRCFDLSRINERVKYIDLSPDGMIFILALIAWLTDFTALFPGFLLVEALATEGASAFCPKLHELPPLSPRRIFRLLLCSQIRVEGADRRFP